VSNTVSQDAAAFRMSHLPHSHCVWRFNRFVLSQYFIDCVIGQESGFRPWVFAKRQALRFVRSVARHPGKLSDEAQLDTQIEACKSDTARYAVAILRRSICRNAKARILPKFMAHLVRHSLNSMTIGGMSSLFENSPS
jgi:hypothetical protein